MTYTGNYNWLQNITTVYGPVSLHMLDISFKYGTETIKINVLLMGDIHTNTPDITETKHKYKLQNFVLNIPKTNKKCFDIFIEAFSPHINKNLRLKNLTPNQIKIYKSITNPTTNTALQSSRPTSTINNLLSVGTNKSLVIDSKNYKIPLIALRNSPLLKKCRYHELYINNIKQTCKYPNIRYHSWDLRFTNIDTDLTILAEITLTYDTILYDYFNQYNINGKTLTKFLMYQILPKEIDNKIRRIFYIFYEKIKNTIKAGNAPKHITHIFKNSNVNADYTFYNFDKQKKLVNKQFNKVPKSIKNKLLKSFIKIYNSPVNYVLAITDFYAICRMLSKFNVKRNRPITCHNPEYSFCQNIIYYAGAQHTQLILEVLLDVFGNKSLHYTTGTKYIKSKNISISKFKTSIPGQTFTNLKTPKNFLDIVGNFYK